jgi:hypothetical protein
MPARLTLNEVSESHRITLAANSPEEIQDSVLVSDGIINARSWAAAPYHDAAWIPRQPWRPLPKKGDCLLARSSSRSMARTIAFFAIPCGAVSRVHRALPRFNSATTAVKLQAQLGRDESCRSVLSDLVALARDLSPHEARIFPCPEIECAEPNLPTITRDASGTLIGLHVDSWDLLPVTEREASSNRVVMNLGRQPRRLLFCNCSLAGMRDLIATKAGAGDTPQEANALIALFMKTFDVPIISVTIPPGFAYIGPTENMIHDGSTMGMDTFDMTFTIRGKLVAPVTAVVA